METNRLYLTSGTFVVHSPVEQLQLFWHLFSSAFAFFLNNLIQHDLMDEHSKLPVSICIYLYILMLTEQSVALMQPTRTSHSSTVCKDE